MSILKQIDQLIDWNSVEKVIAMHYAPVFEAVGLPVYSGLLLFIPPDIHIHADKS